MLFAWIYFHEHQKPKYFAWIIFGEKSINSRNFIHAKIYVNDPLPYLRNN